MRTKLRTRKIIFSKRCALNEGQKKLVLTHSDSVTVGHLPKFMSKLAHFFVKHDGEIRCEITGSKRYSSDLQQGSLEIPAKITFQNISK